MIGLRKYVVALFVAFLYYSAHIAACSVESNRYLDRWERLDAAAIILGMLLLASLFWALGWLVAKLRAPLAQRAFNHLFLLALTGGLLAAFPRFCRDHPNSAQILWMAAMFAIGYSFARNRPEPVRWAANFCLIFSPAVLILSIQMLTWSTWDEPREEPAPVREAQRPGTPVFFFVFDEWSYQRSMEGGEFRPSLKNLRSLAGRSMVFSEARSPWNMTDLSLPRTIFQTDKEVAVRDGTVYLEDGHSAVPARDAPSLFHLAREHGYATCLFGYFLPYRHMLGDQVDYRRECLHNPLSVGLPAKVVLHFYDSVKYWNDPLSKRLDAWAGRVFRQRRRAAWHRQFQGYRQEMLDVLSSSPPRTFAFFHLPLPHAPFVFRPDGSYYESADDPTGPQDYQRQLQYVDTLVGQIVEKLRASGKLDDAAIVLTSDHSWRTEPDPLNRRGDDWQRRVPLLVKLPGQQSGCVVSGAICTSRLRPLLEAVFSGERDTRRLTDVARSLARSASK